MTREPDTNARLILIAAVAAVLVIVVCSIGVGLVLAVEHSSPRRVATASPTPSALGGFVTLITPLTATTGTLVFTDDFHDPQSGWDTSGTKDISYAFANGTFLSTAKGAFNYYEPAPYDEPKLQLSVAATATLDIHTPPDAGFGVDCVRGSGASQIRYEFIASADASWYVFRYTGPDRDTNFPTTIREGSLGSAPAPGVIPVTLVGACATMTDGQTMRLAFFVDGAMVADFSDAAPASSREGWETDLVTSGSDKRPVTVTATHFEERDLSRSGP